MASVSIGSMSIDSSVLDEDEEELEYNHHPHRLSVCTRNRYEDIVVVTVDEDEGEDADGELSDKVVGFGTSDSEKETSFVSLPATALRHRVQRGSLKEYAGENLGQVKKVGGKRKQRRRTSSSVSFRERWMNYSSISSSRQNECLVITRPKGGTRSLCMDLEEVKACRDLGFDLEHEMLELPGRISVSCSTLDDSSGGTSPIANWRISSPGDDPKDVKAKLKVWAQAVALAYTT